MIKGIAIFSNAIEALNDAQYLAGKTGSSKRAARLYRFELPKDLSDNFYSDPETAFKEALSEFGPDSDEVTYSFYYCEATKVRAHFMDYDTVNLEDITKLVNIGDNINDIIRGNKSLEYLEHLIRVITSSAKYTQHSVIAHEKGLELPKFVEFKQGDLVLAEKQEVSKDLVKKYYDSIDDNYDLYYVQVLDVVRTKVVHEIISTNDLTFTKLHIDNVEAYLDGHIPFSKLTRNDKVQTKGLLNSESVFMGYESAADSPIPLREVMLNVPHFYGDKPNPFTILSTKEYTGADFMPFDAIIDTSFVSKRRGVFEILGKCTEELGEVATIINKPHEDHDEPLEGEVSDVIISVVDLLIKVTEKANPDMSQEQIKDKVKSSLSKHMVKKLNKWANK